MDVSLHRHRGPLLLVLAILGFVPIIGIIPFGIVAWILGARDLRRMKAGVMDATGRRLTHIAVVCAIFATAWWALALFLMPISSNLDHG